MAEHIAARDDRDIATFAISVNMTASGGFSPEEFHERADDFVNTIAAAQPEKPITCVTLFLYFDDVTESGGAEHATAYRETLRFIGEESTHGNLSLIKGPELLPLSGLAADLLHPGNYGMKRISDELFSVSTLNCECHPTRRKNTAPD